MSKFNRRKGRKSQFGVEPLGESFALSTANPTFPLPPKPSNPRPPLGKSQSLPSLGSQESLMDVDPVESGEQPTERRPRRPKEPKQPKKFTGKPSTTTSQTAMPIWKPLVMPLGNPIWAARDEKLDVYLKQKYLEIIMSQTRIGTQRADILFKLQSVLREFPVVVRPFGSAVTALGLASSDLDVCVEITGENPHLHRFYNIGNLAKVIRKARLGNMFVIKFARIPLIRIELHSGLSLDINVGHSLGVYNSELIRAYTLLDHRVRPLVMLLKLWASKHDLNSPQDGTLSSYAYTMMAIAYLQSLGILPSLQTASTSQRLVQVPAILSKGEREATKGQAPIMRTVDVSFEGTGTPLYTELSRQIPKEDPSLARVFIGMMTFYGKEFQYMANTGISIKHGSVSLPLGEELQEERYPYLMILDPFEDRNVAETGIKHIGKIINSFKHAALLFESESDPVVIVQQLFK